MARISNFPLLAVVVLAVVTAGKNDRSFDVDAFVVTVIRTPSLMGARGRQLGEQQTKDRIRILHPLLLSEGDSYATENSISSTNNTRQHKQKHHQGEEEDTTRIRIWKVLASSIGKEISLKELGSKVGERNTSELLSHLKHVEKQSKTLQNKKIEWKIRRGLILQQPQPASQAPTTTTATRRRQEERDVNKLRLEIIRKGTRKKKELYIKLS